LVIKVVKQNYLKQNAQRHHALIVKFKIIIVVINFDSPYLEQITVYGQGLAKANNPLKRSGHYAIKFKV
jgi:hypothetical protein